MFSIAIDGPAGAGKSTVAKLVAQRLCIPHLDTGAMYRAIAVYAEQHGVDFCDKQNVEALTEQVQIEVVYMEGIQHILLDGTDITYRLREEQIGKGASLVSRYPAVRDRLSDLQRRVALRECVVLDGRDIGTNVIPETPNKFFVTASAEERAKRRCRQLEQNGETADFAAILRDIVQRDKQDSERAYKPLRCAEDAKIIDTTALSIEEAVNAVLTEVR